MIGGIAVLAATGRAQIDSISSVDLIARLTGPGAMNNTVAFAVGGTDLGHMVVHDGVTYFLFGDTFSGDTPAQGGLWRWNTMAFSTDMNPADGITFDGWIANASGQAREVIHSGRLNPITEIPTAAISVGNRIYAWYMAVNWWGPPGEWSLAYSGLAYSENAGQSFTLVDAAARPSWTNFGMIAASARTDLPAGVDDRIYVWGTPAGRLGGVKLARVAPNQLANLAAYEYFGGLANDEPTWVDSETLSPAIVPPTVGEMSAMYNPAAGRWMLLYFNHAAYAIELRQSITPWGPWSAPLTVATGAQYPALYGSYMHSRYIEGNGETIYFTMSLFGPYDVYWMRARLNIPPCISGDLDRSRSVDLQDLAVLLAHFGATAGASYSDGDLDADADVDLQDLATLLATFGATCDE